MVRDRSDTPRLARATPCPVRTLVGRAGDVGALNHLAREARWGRASSAVVTGPAGIGKSALLRAFLGGDACRHATVLHGMCEEGAADDALGGVRTLLGPAVREAAPEAAACSLPLLAPGALAGEPPHAPAVQRAFHGLYRLAADELSRGPLVLALDGAHHCDELSLRWLDFLLRRADGLPLLVVLAQQAEATGPAHGAAAHRALTDLAARRGTTTLRLRPLTEPDVAELVRQFFREPAAPAFVTRAWSVTGGNPRLLERLLCELRGEGAGSGVGGADRIAETGGRVLACWARELLDRRPSWVGEVARAVAVLGERGADHVGPLAAVPADVVEDALAVLREAGLLAPGGRHLVHGAVRAAVLAPLDAQELSGLRTRAALLLSDAGRPAEEVADHLLPLPSISAPWMPGVLLEAAVRAEVRGAPETAARYLYRVREVDPDSVEVRVRLARALAESDPSEAIGLLRGALGPGVDIRTRARIAAQFGTTCLAARDSSAALGMLEDVLDALGADLGPDPLPADRELCTLVESVLLIVGSHGRSTLAATRKRAAMMTVPEGDTPAQRQKLAAMAVLTALDDQAPEPAVGRALHAACSPQLPLKSWSLINSSFVLGLADRTEDALHALDRLLRHGRENSALWTYSVALSSRALLLQGLGALPDALADARTAVQISSAERWGEMVVLPRVALAGILVDRGEAAHAAKLLTGIGPAWRDQYVWTHHRYLLTRGRARHALGDAEGALALFRECGRSLEEAEVRHAAYLPWWAEAACALAELGRAEEAREPAAHGTRLARRWGTPRVLGLAALARGVATPGERGVELLGEAVRELSASPARVEHARAELVLGKALLAADDRRAAREHLRAAADLAQRCGALALGQHARGALLAAGGRMRKMTASPLDLLTSMERRVAGLAAGGATNRSIAQSLHVSVRTVETHLTSVYRKLDIAERAQLAAVLRSPGVHGARVPRQASRPRGQR
ncbi:putative regulatory protein [Streptomyces sp. NBRC 110611]|uniref:ATP-binding protein n=1 Tax=Streptomyces sp. NBRC 110611 TaxID=1621259 RepID=UPI000832EC2F|nr:LuxR family transcriptional regulator [Streptomyces sp. NBRC 110611]GAU69348.1 putative regulatory protein [Streptomyces sp. NBRC 110611]